MADEAKLIIHLKSDAEDQRQLGETRKPPVFPNQPPTLDLSQMTGEAGKALDDIGARIASNLGNLPPFEISINQPSPVTPVVNQPDPITPDVNQPNPIDVGINQPNPIDVGINQPPPVNPVVNQPAPITPDVNQPPPVDVAVNRPSPPVDMFGSLMSSFQAMDNQVLRVTENISRWVLPDAPDFTAFREELEASARALSELARVATERKDQPAEKVEPARRPRGEKIPDVLPAGKIPENMARQAELQSRMVADKIANLEQAIGQTQDPAARGELQKKLDTQRKQQENMERAGMSEPERIAYDTEKKTEQTRKEISNLEQARDRTKDPDARARIDSQIQAKQKQLPATNQPGGFEKFLRGLTGGKGGGGGMFGMIGNMGGDAGGGMGSAVGMMGPIGTIIAAADMAAKKATDAIQFTGKVGEAVMSFDADRLTSEFNNLTKQIPIVGQVIGAFGDALGGIIGSTDQLAKRLSSYDGNLASTMAMIEVNRLMRDMQRAREMGTELAEYAKSRDQFQAKVEELMQKVAMKIIPALTKIAEYGEASFIIAEEFYNAYKEGFKLAWDYLVSIGDSILPGFREILRTLKLILGALAGDSELSSAEADRLLADFFRSFGDIPATGAIERTGPMADPLFPGVFE